MTGLRIEGPGLEDRMLNNEVVLTYKRKRFSDRFNVVRGVEATDSSSDSPNQVSTGKSTSKAESNTYKEKLGEDNAHCSRCGAFDVNENLLDCDSCSGTYHLRCSELPFKNIPQGKWWCSACIRRQVFEESMQQQVQKSSRTRSTRSTKESNMGPMKLRSNKLLLSIKSVKDSSGKASLSMVDTSPYKMEDPIQLDNSADSVSKVASIEGTSRSQRTDLEIVRKSSPACLNSGCQDDSFLMTMNLNKKDNVMCNDEHTKENSSTPLITFSRRVKKKQVIGEKFTGRNPKAMDMKPPLATLNGHSLDETCKNEGVSPKCSITDQSSNVAVIQRQIELHPSHMLQRDKKEMSHVKFDGQDGPEDAGLETTVAGGFPDAKTNDTIGEGLPSCSEERSKQRPCNHSEHVHEDPLNEVLATRTADVNEESILVHNNKLSNSANVNTSVREESGNKLAIAANSSVKTAMLCNSLEQDLLIDEELSFPLALSTCPSNLESNRPSVGTVTEELSTMLHASTCVSVVEINKLSVDVMPEKMAELQSSPTQNCVPVSLDEKSYGKGKGLEWLETLDRALQEKKDINISFLVEQGGISCGQESNGNSSRLLPRNSFAQASTDQDASSELMNQFSPFQGRSFLTKLDDPVNDKLQHEETLNIPSHTNFLGLSLPLNSEAPTSAVKKFRSMSSPSLSGKDNGVYTRQVPWHVLDKNSSLSRHKQIVDNVMMGSWMVNERQASLLKKFKRYSVEWSEDELDSLWIGVRRHGIDNWNAMLKDPKLFFSESRVAEDLAEQWNIEQKKLFNNTLIQPVRLSKSDILPSPVVNDVLLSKPAAGNHCGHYGAWSSEFQRLSTETRLSLGDVYLQKENVPKRNMSNTAGPGRANLLMDESPSVSSLLGSSSKGSMGITNHNPFQAQSRKYTLEPSSLLQMNEERSSHAHHSSGISAGSNLPHWLKEVFSMPPRSHDLGLATGVSMNANSVSMPNNDQWVDSPFPGEAPAPPKYSRRRGILKRRGMACGNNTGCNEPWMEGRPGEHSNQAQNFLKPAADTTGLDRSTILDLNKISSGPTQPSELVVIDSGASSEETISDDQSSRP